jgi:hypothetical protein
VVARLAADQAQRARGRCAAAQRAAARLPRAGAGPELLQQLLALGVDPQQDDAEGRRADRRRDRARRWPQVAVLDPEYALPATVAEDSPTASCCAARATCCARPCPRSGWRAAKP